MSLDDDTDTGLGDLKIGTWSRIKIYLMTKFYLFNLCTKFGNRKMKVLKEKLDIGTK